VASEDDLPDMRMFGSLVDYDGDGDTMEGVNYEIDAIEAMLYAEIQSYASTVIGTPIVYDSHSYPYFFIDSNGNGVVDPGENIYPNKYSTWTARLVKATYNYQFSQKDPGAYAHGGKYMVQLMIDSIEDLGGDISALARDDEGHFDGAAEAWRHWDEDGEVRTSCAKCHSDMGLSAFLADGENLFAEPIAGSGMLCLNCHTAVTDTVAPRRASDDVEFPSGDIQDMADDSDLCLNCHQGRASQATIDDKIAASPAPDNGTMSASNPHYYAAAAVLYGADVNSGYEYSSKTYADQNVFPGHGGAFNTCTQCHMGNDAFPGGWDHNLTRPSQDNCLCHSFDAPQGTAADFFKGIRKIDIDYDGDADQTESLRVELETLEAALYAELQTYSTTAQGGPILYAGSYPYWFKDTNGNGLVDPGEAIYPNQYGANMDQTQLKAAFNYLVSLKEPGAYIHNALYIAQLLVDSIEDLGGDVSAYTWR